MIYELKTSVILICWHIFWIKLKFACFYMTLSVNNCITVMTEATSCINVLDLCWSVCWGHIKTKYGPACNRSSRLFVSYSLCQISAIVADNDIIGNHLLYAVFDYVGYVPVKTYFAWVHILWFSRYSLFAA